MIYKNTSPMAEYAMEEHRLFEDCPPMACVHCGEEVYPGSLYYDVEGEIVCSQCIREHLFDVFSEDYLRVLE